LLYLIECDICTFCGVKECNNVTLLIVFPFLEAGCPSCHSTRLSQNWSKH